MVSSRRCATSAFRWFPSVCAQTTHHLSRRLSITTKGTDMATRTAARTPMSTTRKLALAAGLFYIATFVFSIPALPMYDSVLNNADWVNGAGSDAGVLWGGLFEVITGLTGIAT